VKERSAYPATQTPNHHTHTKKSPNPIHRRRPSPTKTVPEALHPPSQSTRSKILKANKEEKKAPTLKQRKIQTFAKTYWDFFNKGK
jgi:hypothetical protein